MTDDRRILGRAGELDSDVLVDYLRDQRWFGARTREIVGATAVDSVRLTGSDLSIALVDANFRTGTRELFQLLLEDRVGKTFDATARPELAQRLVELVAVDGAIDGRDGRLTCQSIRPIAATDAAEIHAIAGEQSNSSVVVGEVILKTYRRIEPGVNPELDILLFFAEHGFKYAPSLVGWYGYQGERIDATLGIVQCFVPDTTDGWKLGLREGDGSPDGFLRRLHQMGTVVGEMHAVLASDTADAAFAPEEPTPESTGLLTAKIDEEIDAIFDEFSEREEIAPLAGRRDDAHALLASLAGSSSPGRIIRTHGDLHLGQMLWNGQDWFVIDFEGEPARPASSRRQKSPPLRDVAGLLRSISYLAWTLTRGDGVPRDGWERDARRRLLDGYRETVSSTVLPQTVEAQERQLGMFELEKAFYELRYELDHRPDYAPIPVHSILSILEPDAS
jgi:maltokinase